MLLSLAKEVKKDYFGTARGLKNLLVVIISDYFLSLNFEYSATLLGSFACFHVLWRIFAHDIGSFALNEEHHSIGTSSY